MTTKKAIPQIADTGNAGALPDIRQVPLSSITTRPDVFQPRDVPRGQDHDPEKVAEIVRRWNPGRFDPIAVTPDPDRPGGYIVIAGHHRLEAVRQMEIQQVPVKVLAGDITVDADRQRLVTEADLSNYGIAEPGLAEQVRTVRNLRAQDWDNSRIANEMRLRPGRVDELGWLSNLREDEIAFAAAPEHRQFLPVAIEVGRGVSEYGLTDGESQALFNRLKREFNETRRVPSKVALREQLRLNYLRAQERARQRAGESAGAPGGQYGFAGQEFEESAFLGQLLDTAAEESGRRAELQRIRRGLTSCEALASELKVDVSEVQRAAKTRETMLTADQADAVRTQMSSNDLDGDGVPNALDPEPMEDDSQLARRQMQESGAGDLFGAPSQATRQPGLGDEFANNRTFGMPLSGGPGSKASPMVDMEQEQAKSERRDVLARGGSDMFDAGKAGDDSTYYYRETGPDGVTTTHVEADSPGEAAEILEDISSKAGPSEPDAAAAVIQVDTETGQTKVDVVEVPPGAEPQTPRRLKFTPVGKRQGGLRADEAQVRAAAADGVITAAEAETASGAAGRVMAAAEKDTPDGPAPKKGYDSRDDINRRIEEICNDPEQMRQLLERAKASRQKSAQEQAADGGETVTGESRSAAAQVLNRARQDSPAGGRPQRPPKARISDEELLRRAVDSCQLHDPSAPVAEEAKKFLRSSGARKVQFRSKSPRPSSPADTGLASFLAGSGSGRKESSGRTRTKSGKSTRRRAAPSPVITYR